VIFVFITFKFTALLTLNCPFDLLNFGNIPPSTLSPASHFSHIRRHGQEIGMQSNSSVSRWICVRTSQPHNVHPNRSPDRGQGQKKLFGARVEDLFGVFEEQRAHGGADGCGVGGFVGDGFFLASLLLCCDEFGKDALSTTARLQNVSKLGKRG